MQLFWFFYTNKRTGVWGKAPTKFKNIKLKIYKFSFETSIIILVQKIK